VNDLAVQPRVEVVVQVLAQLGLGPHAGEPDVRDEVLALVEHPEQVHEQRLADAVEVHYLVK